MQMKKEYIRPLFELENMESDSLLAGTTPPMPPKGEDYTGGGEGGPGEGGDDVDVGAKGNHFFFWGDDEY